MFQIGQEMFVSVGGGDNALEPVTVSGADVGGLTLTFVDDEPPATSSVEDQSVMLFFNGADGFMQQPAKIVEPINDERAFKVVTTGDAVSGESRQFFRVSTVLVDYHACVGEDESCKVVDVSSMGMAAISIKQHAIGDCLPVSFALGQQAFRGECVVQSVRETRGGWRYGLLCVNGQGAGNLDDGLHKLTMDAQRTQLKRLSGAA